MKPRPDHPWNVWERAHKEDKLMKQAAFELAKSQPNKYTYRSALIEIKRRKNLEKCNE